MYATCICKYAGDTLLLWDSIPWQGYRIVSILFGNAGVNGQRLV